MTLVAGDPASCSRVGGSLRQLATALRSNGRAVHRAMADPDLQRPGTVVARARHRLTSLAEATAVLTAQQDEPPGAQRLVVGHGVTAASRPASSLSVGVDGPTWDTERREAMACRTGSSKCLIRPLWPTAPDARDAHHAADAAHAGRALRRRA